MLTLHPPSFIETETCDGPRYTRGQPSRENDGVIMTKYIPNFELPSRNLKSWLGTIDDSMERINEEEKNEILEKFCSGKIEKRIKNAMNLPSTPPDPQKILDDLWAVDENRNTIKEWASKRDMFTPKTGFILFILMFASFLLGILFYSQAK